MTCESTHVSAGVDQSPQVDQPQQDTLRQKKYNN